MLMEIDTPCLPV